MPKLMNQQAQHEAHPLDGMHVSHQSSCLVHPPAFGVTPRLQAAPDHVRKEDVNIVGLSEARWKWRKKLRSFGSNLAKLVKALDGRLKQASRCRTLLIQCNCRSETGSCLATPRAIWEWNKSLGLATLFTPSSPKPEARTIISTMLCHSPKLQQQTLVIPMQKPETQSEAGWKDVLFSDGQYA